MLADALDCDAYLVSLREAAGAEHVAVHAYALLPTQVCLLVTPQDATALSAMQQAIGRRFVSAYNRRHRLSGPLWQGRFGAAVVETDAYFLACLRFVELAPVRAGLVERAEDWPWSSAAHHCGRRRSPGIAEHRAYWATGNTPFEREIAHAQLLEKPFDPSINERLANAALHGWALGSAAFIEAMGGLAMRRLAPLPRGRRAKTP